MLKGNGLRHFLAVGFLIAAVFLAYANSLHGIWAFDDLQVNQPIGINGLLDKIGWRKIALLSFYINQKIDPYSPFNFRLLNLLIHTLNALLVYALAFITLRLTDLREKFGQYSFPAAFLAAAIFALHPLNINAVAYIIQRMASLAAFFVLLSLLFSIMASATRSLTGKTILYGLTLISILSGVLAKENAVLAVPLILLYDYFFISRFQRKPFLIKSAAAAVIVICVLIGLNFYLPLFKEAMQIGRNFLALNRPLSYQGWMATDVYWSPLEHILTEFRVISRYLFLFVVPYPGFFVFDRWGYPVSKTLFDPVTTLFSFLLIAGLLIFSLLKMKRYPFLAFGILWYFIALSLESFVAVGVDLYFEHRNYLPLAGLSFGLAAQVTPFILNKIGSRKYLFPAGVCFIAVLLGVCTYERNVIWKDPVTFWKDDFQKAPDNPRASLALANSYYSIADFQNADTFYRDTIKIASGKNAPYFMTEAIYRLGFMDISLERGSESKKIIDIFGRVSPLSYKLKILEGYYRYLNNDFENAIKDYHQVADLSRIDPMDRVTVFTLMGDAYRADGRTGDAAAAYEQALRINYSFPAALHGMAKVQLMEKNYASSFAYLRTVLLIDSYNIGALTDMANLMMIEGAGVEKAMPFAKRAVSLNPPFHKPYLIMGTLLTASGEEGDAGHYFAKAKEFRAPDYLIFFNKAWAYSIRGDRGKQKYYLTKILKEKDVPQNIRDTAHTLLSRLSG
jgi:tetratricopeptide (TPR) repeat protein